MALSVRREIYRRIKDEGRITFAQFMELALLSSFLQGQYSDNVLIRPLLEYTGPMDLEYVPLEERG